MSSMRLVREKKNEKPNKREIIDIRGTRDFLDNVH